MKNWFFLFALGVPVSLQGQSSNITTLFQSSFKKAENMYQHLAYRNALELFLYTVERNPNNQVARQRVADCYFRLGNVREAEQWYAELVQMPNVDPFYKYQYGQVLSIQGKYSDAQKWFAEYIASKEDDPRARSKLEFIYYLSYYFRDSVLYDIENEYFNSDQSDFAPQYYKDGIVFVSARDRDLFVKRKSMSALNDEEAMLNIYFAPNDTASDVRTLYRRALNTPYHDGPVAFFDQGRHIVFSRTNESAGKPLGGAEGKANLQLYFGRVSGSDQLTQLEPFSFNDREYSIGHPWISEDGNTLYFASDMPGGYGGADIYVSHRSGSRWSKPVNLGPEINTLGNEFFPYWANDSTLYFASNGHGGLGGLDIYLARFSRDKFSHPENLGFPLNTSHDDFALVMAASGREGLFSSDREGGLGYDDVYHFRVKSFFLVGKTVERSDRLLVVPGVDISVYDSLSGTSKTVRSDTRGYFHMDLSFDNVYLFSARKEGYEWLDSVRFSTQTRTMGTDTVYIPLWKHSLFVQGSIFSNETQSQLHGATVILENLTDGTVDSLVTSDDGSYKFLVIPNKKYRVSARKEGFISEGFNLNTSGLFSGNLVNDILLEEVFEEKLIVQFDFDKSDLREEYIPQLEEMIKGLKTHPTTTLNIGAHADSRGTFDYNKHLSDRRAQAAVDFFVSHGIARNRIEATGFGEELLLNRCSDGVECTEQEHSKNRRAELKVQMGPIE